MEAIKLGPPPRYWGLVLRQLKRSALNRLAIYLLIGLALLAILAPVLANSTPVYAQKDGKIYFPILQKIWPLYYLHPYPELRGVDFGKWQEDGATLVHTFVPYSPDDYDLDAILLPPNQKHFLGTDEQGRDVLSRMIYGSQVSLSVGFVAVSIYTLLGIILGALAGFFGGRFDMLLSRIIEIVICFPTFFLILTLLSVLGPSIFYIMIAIGITGWTGIARLTRGEFLKLRNQDFVIAAQSQGTPTRRLLFRHILPNAMAPLLINATFGIGAAILIESSLSFLGFGVQPPTPSWGDLLSQSRDFMDIAWWLTLFPGLAIFITITCFNLLGEGLRDALDPKLRMGE